MVIIYKDF
jgi:hypothetical protein